MSRRRYSVPLNGKLRCNPHTSEPSINAAIEKGYFQQVRFLIELGHSVNGTNRHGRTPLMSCALVEEESWGVGLARLLLEKCATLRPRDKHGLTAMHYSCIYERVGLAETFLKATDFNLNQQDRFGNTALHYSVTSGNVEITQMIINFLVKYKQTVDIKNAIGVTPLLQAWRSGNPVCAQMLVELGNADQDICDPHVNKCSRDYEIELMAKANSMSQETLKSESSVESNDCKLPGYMRPVGGVKTRLSQRTQSAPPGGRSGRLSNASRTTRIGSAYPSNKNNNNVGSIVGKEDISLRLYTDAGHLNPRNNPEFVFKSSPTQCFVSDYAVNSHKNTPCASLDSSPTKFGENIGPCWKSEIKTLVNSYQFQWSESYRKSIIPRPATPPSSLTGEEEDELLDLRPSSPAESEALSRRSSRKYTGIKSLQSALMGFGDGMGKGGHASRRSSVISNGGRSRRGSVASVASLLLSEPQSTTSSEGSVKKKSKPMVPRAWRAGQDSK